MIYVPRIGSPDLIRVVWCRNRRVLWHGAGKGGEGSGCIVGSCLDLIPGGGRLIGV